MHSRRIAILLFTGVTVAGCGQKSRAAEWESTGPTVLTVTAKGVQIYRYERGEDGKLAWRFVAPQAELFDDGLQRVGTHSRSESGPQWEIGGDVIIGTKVHERTASRPGAVPELQLTGRCTGSGATFGKVVMIERLDTEGGVAPAGEGHKASDEEKVPYQARYVFHAARN